MTHLALHAVDEEPKLVRWKLSARQSGVDQPAHLHGGLDLGVCARHSMHAHARHIHGALVAAVVALATPSGIFALRAGFLLCFVAAVALQWVRLLERRGILLLGLLLVAIGARVVLLIGLKSTRSVSVASERRDRAAVRMNDVRSLLLLLLMLL